MNKQHIHCIINDCHYYGQGNKCMAEEILVTTNDFGVIQPDEVDCNMAAELSPQTAGTCMGTCCKTYVPKDSNKTTVDGVKKMC
ncbi:MAG: DUF1540 domain-containing protein [Clostridia bacterium]|nr:DUF1540 domain-containing protein [Clostridia bacterium]